MNSNFQYRGGGLNKRLFQNELNATSGAVVGSELAMASAIEQATAGMTGIASGATTVGSEIAMASAIQQATAETLGATSGAATVGSKTVMGPATDQARSAAGTGLLYDGARSASMHEKVAQALTAVFADVRSHEETLYERVARLEARQVLVEVSTQTSPGGVEEWGARIEALEAGMARVIGSVQRSEAERDRRHDRLRRKVAAELEPHHLPHATQSFRDDPTSKQCKRDVWKAMARATLHEHCAKSAAEYRQEAEEPRPEGLQGPVPVAAPPTNSSPAEEPNAAACAKPSQNSTLVGDGPEAIVARVEEGRGDAASEGGSDSTADDRARLVPRTEMEKWAVRDRAQDMLEDELEAQLERRVAKAERGHGAVQIKLSVLIQKVGSLERSRVQVGLRKIFFHLFVWMHASTLP